MFEFKITKIAGLFAVGFLVYGLISASSFAKAKSNPTVEEDCTYCHEVMNRPNVHEAAMIGCTECHYSHQELNDKNPVTGKPVITLRFANHLKDKGNDLCYSCHEKSQIVVDEQGRGHPYARHPTLGWRNPLKPEEKLTCVSCHSPHSANHRKLIRLNYAGPDRPEGACYICHEDTVGAESHIPR